MLPNRLSNGSTYDAVSVDTVASLVSMSRPSSNRPQSSTISNTGPGHPAVCRRQTSKGGSRLPFTLCSPTKPMPTRWSGEATPRKASRRASSLYLLSGVAKWGICGKTKTAPKDRNGMYPLLHLLLASRVVGGSPATPQGSMTGTLKRSSSTNLRRKYSPSPTSVTW